MAERGAMAIQMSGFAPAHRDAKVVMENTATGQTITRAPFLDGSLTIRDVDPGLWQVKVIHPNLITPIFEKPIRVFPQPQPTYVPVPIPATIFRDTPIRDIADANIAPVQQAATAARDALAPLAAKAPGEAIRAADWNALVGAVRDLAGSLSELTQLVAPRGHNHPEIEEKIAEVQGNIRSFTESFGRSLLEFRRELEALHFRRQLNDALVAAQTPQGKRDELLGRVDRLTDSLSADPAVFTAQLSSASSRVLVEMADIVTAKPDLQGNPAVQKTQQIAQAYVATGTVTSAASELGAYNRTGAAAGGKLGSTFGGR